MKMKKHLFLSLFIILSLTIVAQDVTLKFTGASSNGKYVKLDSVQVVNVTKSWNETLLYPDTILTLKSNVGIGDYNQNSLSLFQNIPNPFDGKTDVALNVAEKSQLNLDVFDMYGRRVASLNVPSLPNGKHYFRISLASPQTYMLTATQKGVTSSIKMVNYGHGGENKIEFLSSNAIGFENDFNTKSERWNAFNMGDQMVYVGYASKNGKTYVSDEIRQMQIGSQDFVLRFADEINYRLPVVTTDSIFGSTKNSFNVAATLVDEGFPTNRTCGFCWATFPNPTIENDFVYNTTADPVFTQIIENLAAGTTYYVRAFATNEVGTAYGEELTWTAPAEPGMFDCEKALVMDVDGNRYATVQIGKQCWMKENLKTTKFFGGTEIALGSSTVKEGALRYYPGGNSANVEKQGYLYNWMAAMQSKSYTNASKQSICPAGWHIPDTQDWNELVVYVGSQKNYLCDTLAEDVAKALAASEGWQTTEKNCTPGNHQDENNLSGFGAQPSGLYDFSSQQATYYEQFSAFWCADNATETAESIFYLTFTSPKAIIQRYSKKGAVSVRCLRDPIDSSAVLPTVVTAEVTDVKETSVLTGGNVVFDGESGVMMKGVCYSTKAHPTIEDDYTIDDCGQGSFVSHLSNLKSATTYFVRAYAMNNVGISYGNEIVFMTYNPNDGALCADLDSVYDNDGNAYATVQIGGQCWTRDHLRTTTYSDGTPIAMGATMSKTEAYRYMPRNDSSFVKLHGYLYNWKAVMHDAESSNEVPSGVQGVCPTGWHVPSNAEWTQLTDYVNSQEKYRCNSKPRAIAKAIASTDDKIWWYTTKDTYRCGVGDGILKNNATGFNIHPAGAYYGEATAGGRIATLWSCTAADNGTAYYRFLQYFYAYVGSDNHDVANGFSVRCVKD